jgi:uncharacterized protein YkwD
MVLEVSARPLAGVKVMYRVALCAGLAISLAACSLGTSSVSSNYSPATETRSLPEKKVLSQASLGGEPSAARGVKVASLDKAPPGTYESASKGALSDRDYTTTALDIEKARDLVNQYRSEKGLKPLRFNVKLTEAAKDHCRDLAKWDRISHYGSDGSNPWDRVKRTGYKARLTAENVGTGQINFDEVMKGWKDSPGHNKNLLLADAQEMGIALVQDPKTEFKSFWTLVLGTSM